MPQKHTALPDHVPELGYVLISVGMDTDGEALGYEVEGISPEAALGYLTALSDLIRDEIRFGWYQSPVGDEEDEEDEDDGLHP